MIKLLEITNMRYNSSVMGFNLETLQPNPGLVLTANGREAKVLGNAHSLNYRISWDSPDLKNDDLSAGDPYLLWSEVFRNPQPEELSFPLVFTSIDDLQGRNLSVKWDKGPQSLELFSRKLLGLKIFCSLVSPSLEVKAIAKVWNDSPHGIIPQSRFVQVDDVYVGLKSLYAANNIPPNLNEAGNLTAAFTWDVNLSSKQGQEDLIFPVADLEIPFDDQKNLNIVAKALIAGGFSGSIIRSGQFTHYFGDILLPRSEAPKVIGKLVKILTPQSDLTTQAIGDEFISTQDFNQAEIVGEKLLSRHPSGSFTGSRLDLRWAGHIFVDNQGHANLRCLNAKSYGFNPYEIGRIQ